MTGCAVCGASVDGASSPGFRADGATYHLGCAPIRLIEVASEEYRAIVRKGVRYFVEKYGAEDSVPDEAGARFVSLGHAIEAERARRGAR